MLVSSRKIMQSSSSAHDSTFSRKRLFENDDLALSTKKSRTAPQSPPLESVLKSKSSSPTPPSTQIQQSHHPIVAPLSPPVSSFMIPAPLSPSAALLSKQVTKLPSVQQITSKIEASTAKLSTETALSDLKHLSQNKRYGYTNHALDYPDTCVNDDDWRLNLESWIERHFPEKFNNLKNILKFDKPGFDLLNDAILLTELKETLNQQNHTSKKPFFNSRISKKMMSPNSRKNYTLHSRFTESISDDESSLSVTNNQWNQSSSSPTSQLLSINTSPYPDHSSASVWHQNQPTSPTQQNYTYHSAKPKSPIEESTITKTSLLSSPHQHHAKPVILPTWTGHRDTQNPVVLETENFIHTHNHKGPNHTYTIHHHNQGKRRCISCGSDQSPCWRPSWSTTAGQLCNSCGLRYKKTGARCTIDSCRRIPAKGEWAAMKQRGMIEVVNSRGGRSVGYSCLNCGGEVEIREKGS